MSTPHEERVKKRIAELQVKREELGREFEKRLAARLGDELVVTVNSGHPRYAEESNRRLTWQGYQFVFCVERWGDNGFAACVYVDMTATPWVRERQQLGLDHDRLIGMAVERVKNLVAARVRDQENHAHRKALLDALAAAGLSADAGDVPDRWKWLAKLSDDTVEFTIRLKTTERDAVVRLLTFLQGLAAASPLLAEETPGAEISGDAQK